MLQAAGFQVEAAALDRGHHQGRAPDCPLGRLGTIANGRYLSRTFSMLAALPALRRAIASNSVVYASGVDMAACALVAGIGTSTPVVLEVGDIRRIQVRNGAIGRFVRAAERAVAKRCRLIVATAAGFIDGYYRGRLGVGTEAMVVENKLEADEARANPANVPALRPGQPLVDRPLRIGYFGALRCPWSFRVLEMLAARHPDRINVVLAGYPLAPADLDSPGRTARLPNVDFRGPFESPRDLPALYGDVDLVWTCYPSPEEHDADWRWAQAICRSNRFYESCRFGRPMIATAGSADGAEVERLGIGVVLDRFEVDEIWARVSALTRDDWQRFAANLLHLPEEVFTYTTEGEQLAQAITRVAAARP